MRVSNQDAPKPYSPPQLHQRTLDQAKLFLVGHAWVGNVGARELLELLFREPAKVAVRAAFGS